MKMPYTLKDLNTFSFMKGLGIIIKYDVSKEMYNEIKDEIIFNSSYIELYTDMLDETEQKRERSSWYINGLFYFTSAFVVGFMRAITLFLQYKCKRFERLYPEELL